MLDTLTQVAARFGARPGDTSSEALAALVGQLHARLGYDSSQKALWHAAGRAGDPPGLDPVDFWKSWLVDGTSGTCFATTVALGHLFEFLGFTSRMCGWRSTVGLGHDVAGVGVAHGGNVVTTGDGVEWLVETSSPVYHPVRVPAAGGASRSPDGRLTLHHTDRLRMVLQRVSSAALKEYELMVDPLDVADARRAYLEAVTLRDVSVSSTLLVSRTLPGGRIVIVTGDRVLVSSDGRRVHEHLGVPAADMVRTLELLGFSGAYAARVADLVCDLDTGD